jgi:O-methyltransferase
MAVLLKRLVPRPIQLTLSSALVPVLNRLAMLSPAGRWVRRTYTPFADSERERMLLAIIRFCHVNRPIPGYYFEFGCHSGGTMRLAWKHSRHLFEWHYVAFDSFEGLPDVEGIDQLEVFKKGNLATAENDFVEMMLGAGMLRNRLRTVKGFYDRTLTPDLAASLGGRKAAVICIDCDLYASTRPVLEFIKDFLQEGTVIVFDDWFCYRGRPDRGEQRAFGEFRERYPELEFVPFVQTCMAQSFIFTGRKPAISAAATTTMGS